MNNAMYTDCCFLFDGLLKQLPLIVQLVPVLHLTDLEENTPKYKLQQ